MAKMRSYRTRCKNDGENKVFDFFKDNLSDGYIVWSNINLITKTEDGIKEPEVDFILYHPKLGLILFEVKDWRADQITRISRDSVYVGSRKKRNPNPYDYTKQKSYTLKTRMEGYKEFITKNGCLKTPINVAVIFPYISRKEWDNALTLLDVVDSYSCGLPPEKILFSENFSEKETDYLGMMKNLRADNLSFPSSLEEKDLDLLDELLGKPEGKKSLYEDSSGKNKILADKKLIVLDEKQKEKADKFLKMVNTSPGHLIIKGVAGGGKTVILLHLFSLVARNPNVRIAYIGRQRELVDEFRENLRDLGIDPDSSYYAVETFHTFFLRYFPIENYDNMVKSKNGYPNDDEIKEFLKNHWEDLEGEYDFMFIDEGHNLPDEWIKMLVLKTQGQKNGNLVYVEDFEQNIYKIKRNTDAAFLGKRKEDLKRNYRNTVQVQKFAVNLTDKDRKVELLHEKKYMRQGPVPASIYSDSKSKNAYELATKVETWIKEDNVPPEEIAIIYPSSEGGKDSMVSAIIKAFELKNMKLLSHYRKADRINKKFSTHNNVILPSRQSGARISSPALSANFITAFSSQGMSYRCVAVVMENFDMKDRWSKEQSTNLMYIALTRATYELVLVFGSPADPDCLKTQVLLSSL